MSLYHKRDGTTDSPVQRIEPTRNQVGEKGAALQTAQPRNGCCYTGAIAYPKSWYDCLLTLQTANPETVVLYGSGRLPQEWYDRILRPRSNTSTPTTRSPTPRVVRLTTLPKKRHTHSNNSVAYSKSGTINYFAQRGTQALQQLGRLPQERHDRLRCPRRGTNTPTTRSSTPRAVQSTTSTKERHKHSKQLGRRPKERNKLWQSRKKPQGKTGQNLSILFKDI